jgi:hypothetical protein
MQLTLTSPGALSAPLPAFAGFPAFANGKSQSFREHYETASGSIPGNVDVVNELFANQ